MWTYVDAADTHRVHRRTQVHISRQKQQPEQAYQKGLDAVSEIFEHHKTFQCCKGDIKPGYVEQQMSYRA